MSPVFVNVQIPAETQAAIQKFDAAREDVPKAIAQGLTRALEVVKKRLVSERLVGKGPFPVSEHRLGQVIRQLSQSVVVTPAIVISEGTRSTVVGGIGSPLVYARAHEFGYRGTVKYTARHRRILFGKKVKARTEVTRRMNIPARAPFRTAITENLDYIRDEIAKEIGASLA